MGARIKVKLSEAKVMVIDPLTGVALTAGKVCEVPVNQFWLRRLEAGEVVRCTENAKPAKRKKRERGVKR